MFCFNQIKFEEVRGETKMLHRLEGLTVAKLNRLDN